MSENANLLNIRRKTHEQWQDSMARMYPELHSIVTDGHIESTEKILSRNVTFQVTDACNLCCTYCYQINKGHRRMSFETAKKMVDLLLSGEKGFSNYISLEKSPGIIIEFIGGEPFMEIELIDQICDYFLEQCILKKHPWATKFCFSICSNGVLYFDPRVQKFLNKHRGHVSFSISIDGNKDLHDACRIFPDGSGSYDIAVKGAQDWMNRGNFMGSKITIAPGNLKYLYDAIVHMVELGYDEINANCVYEKGWDYTHATDFYYELKRIADYFVENKIVEDVYCSLFETDMFRPKNENDLDNWCGGTGSMLACDPDGYLYPCLRYMESSLGTEVKPMVIGHVDTGLGLCEDHSHCIDCLNKITRKTQSTNECFYCPIAEGCSWCFKAGTMITTPYGFVPIECIRPGDLVISGSGNVRMVEDINTRFTTDTLVVSATGTLPIHTTTEHPFLVRNFRRSGANLIYDEPQWKKACEIKKSDKIALFVNKFGNIHIDENIAYLVGSYLGNGWKTEYIRGNCLSTEYHLCCNYNKCDRIESIFEAANISYNKDKTERTAQEYNIHITNHSESNMNKVLVSILSECGRYAYGKRIPNQVYYWDESSIKALLTGYFESDGSYDEKRDVVKFTTVSYDLAQGLSSLILMFGKKFNWCIRENNTCIIEGREVNTRTAYELSFLIREPERKYYEFDPINGIMWVNVKDVLQDTPGIVYNMSVEEDHTFIANGVIVHNCSAYNYQEFGTPDHRATYICCMHKGRALGNAYLWSRYLTSIGSEQKYVMYMPKSMALEVITEEEYNELMNNPNIIQGNYKDCMVDGIDWSKAEHEYE